MEKNYDSWQIYICVIRLYRRPVNFQSIQSMLSHKSSELQVSFRSLCAGH